MSRAAAAVSAVLGSRRRRRRAGSGIRARPTAGTWARRRSRRGPGLRRGTGRRRPPQEAPRPGARAARRTVRRLPAGTRRCRSPGRRHWLRRRRGARSRPRHGFKDLPERGPARHRPRRKVGAGVEGPAVGQQEDGHGPAALAADRLRGGHVDGVDVGALFPVHLDGDKVRVQVLRGGLVLEGFMGHDVAPVAGRVADRQEHRHVPGGRVREGLVAERLPVHRVAGVLAQVGRGFRRQGVRGPGLRVGSPRSAVSGSRITVDFRPGSPALGGVCRGRSAVAEHRADGRCRASSAAMRSSSTCAR